MNITVTTDVASLVRLGALAVSGLDNRREDVRLTGELEAAASWARQADLAAQVQAIRAMYRRTGVDPTRTRPSSEALLRRVRRGDPLPRISPLVDVCNWCSLEYQVPYGLYDLDRVAGDTVSLRLGRPGEEFPGIRKETVHVAGRLALVDAEGPFGNPTSDSARTMVTPETRRALVVVYAPRGLEAAAVGRILDATAERAGRFTGAREDARSVS